MGVAHFYTSNLFNQTLTVSLHHCYATLTMLAFKRVDKPRLPIMNIQNWSTYKGLLNFMMVWNIVNKSMEVMLCLIADGLSIIWQLRTQNY